MDNEFYCDLKLNENIELLADYASKEIGKHIISFDEFLSKQNEYHQMPIKPNKPIPRSNDPREHQLFESRYNQALRVYNQLYLVYQKNIQEQNFFKQYQNNKQGYIDYLKENHQEIGALLNRTVKIPITEQNRQHHTYISGGIGTGKSEAIKSFIWHYLTKHQNSTLILLSPHSEISMQVAKFYPNFDNNKLAYINPSLDFAHFPCLNPFDIPNKKNISDFEAETYANDFYVVFKEIMKGYVDADISIQMENLLKSVLPIFIKMESSNIYDLIDFLDPQVEEEKGTKVIKLKIRKCIDFANSHITNEIILNFINNQFLNDGNLKQTKTAIRGRLMTVFSSSLMQQLMRGKKSIDFEGLINGKKLIVFDFSSSSMPAEYKILGLFIIIMVKITTFRKNNSKDSPVSCHFFIDEFHNFITPSLQTILKESRKFKLFLTLAQQQVGADMNADLLDSIMGNTGIKLTGFNEYSSLHRIAKETENDPKSLQKYLKEAGCFSLWQRRNFQHKIISPIVRMPKNTLGENQSMSEDQWQKLLQTQIELFYRAS